MLYHKPDRDEMSIGEVYWMKSQRGKFGYSSVTSARRLLFHEPKLSTRPTAINVPSARTDLSNFNGRPRYHFTDNPRIEPIDLGLLDQQLSPIGCQRDQEPA
jgi:hypothetical protein